MHFSASALTYVCCLFAVLSPYSTALPFKKGMVSFRKKKEEFVLCAGASLHFLSFFLLRTERLVRCLCKVQRIERALKWLFHRKENAGTLDWAMSKGLAKLAHRNIH
jgi:hypothetical protein